MLAAPWLHSLVARDFAVQTRPAGRAPVGVSWHPAVILTVLVATSFVAFSASAQDRRTLEVGTKEAPPFALKGEDGSWEGVSIDLWRQIADELKLDYVFRELTVDELVSGVEGGSLDVAVAALTTTSEREARVDFTHPFHISGLGIAVAAPPGSSWLSSMKRVFSRQFLQIVIVLFVLLLAVGTLLWSLERRGNPDQFGGGALSGLGAGLWWSAVTMTTVGYGDKTPRSTWGRAVALLWMFASIAMVAGFIAAITSALTVDRLVPALDGPEDLPSVRVVTVAGTTSEDYLRRQRINYRAYSSPEQALQVLVASETDAVVYDAPILRYFVAAQFAGRAIVLPAMLDRQDYGIALPSGSVLREPMNRLILRVVEDPGWQDVLFRYMGRQ